MAKRSIITLAGAGFPDRSRQAGRLPLAKQNTIIYIAGSHGNPLMRRKRAALLGLAATLAIITGVYLYDWYLVETSPVGSYYHYEFRISASSMNTTNYTLVLPMIAYQNGSRMDALFPRRVSGDLDFSEVATPYGPALRLEGRGNVYLGANGTYDALHLSEDHNSDGTPALSLWDRPADWPRGSGRTGDNGTIRMYSSQGNITISVFFEAWSKWWHLRDGAFHSGYDRGGRGYSLSVFGMSSPLVLDEGWGNYSVRCGTIAVE